MCDLIIVKNITILVQILLPLISPGERVRKKHLGKAVYEADIIKPELALPFHKKEQLLYLHI